ncbi:NUDIX domain-containing protein [Kitasatospora purpeofusca]|uniref:NUDIX domain-containing protein n=1 Tax=Kitasatospora purpeofusca TaxID=67352 RepID=UPI003668C175
MTSDLLRCASPPLDLSPGTRTYSNNLALVHVVHVEQSYDGLGQFILFVFATDRWSGELVNTEPDKHLAAKWVAPADLPEPAFPTARIALTAYQEGGPSFSRLR